MLKDSKTIIESNNDLIQEVYGKRVQKGRICLSRLWKKRSSLKDTTHPGWDDHSKLFYNKDTDEYTYICEPYQLDLEQLEDIVNIAKNRNLHVDIRSDVSLHYPGKTFSIIFETKEGFQKRQQK